MRTAILSCALLAVAMLATGSAMAGFDGDTATAPKGINAGVSPTSETIATPDDACELDPCDTGQTASVTFTWGGAEVEAGRPTCTTAPLEATDSGSDCEITEPTYRIGTPDVAASVEGLDAAAAPGSSGDEGGFRTANTATTGAGGDVSLGGAELAAVGIGATGLMMLPMARKLLFLLLSPFATRLRRDELLEDGTRCAIYEMVNNEPGINLKAMGERLDVAWGTLLHHVRKLEDAHLIVSERYGKYRRYFPNGGTYSRDEKAQLAALASPATARVADAISAHPGRNQREIGSLLDVSPSTVLWHVKRLEEVELVHTQREGRCVRYYPSDDLMAA